MDYKADMKPFGSTEAFRAARRVPPRAAAGFSLIELLVTMALMVILTMMMWGFASPSHQRNEQRACQQNLQKLYVAMQIYANDFAGKLPVNTNALTSEEVLDLLVPRYSADTSLFICPGSKDAPLPAGEPLRKLKISYAYYMGWRLNATTGALMSDKQVNTLPKNAGDLAFSTTGSPPGNNHHKYGGNFLFGDGHVDLTPPAARLFAGGDARGVLLNPKP